jgi:hypothetical protein
LNNHIGRNEECPCGSGKNYKKCCGGESNVISINRIIENEFEDIQAKILSFAFSNYSNQIEISFDEIIDELILDSEEDENFYRMIHAIWYTLFERQLNTNGGTIMEEFISKKLSFIKRTKMKEIVKTWDKPVIVVGRLTQVSELEGLVEDFFSGKEYSIYLESSDLPQEIGTFILAMLVPYENKFIPYPTIFDVEEKNAKRIERYLLNEYEDSGYETPEEYFLDYFVETINIIPLMAEEMEVEDYPWPQEAHKEVARIFSEKLKEIGEHEEEREYGITVWNTFCQIRPKRVKNPAIYAASLHYYMLMISPNSKTFTQYEIADLYQVSKGRISEIYLEIRYVIMNELEKFVAVDDEEDWGNSESGYDEWYGEDILEEDDFDWEVEDDSHDDK